ERGQLQRVVESVLPRRQDVVEPLEVVLLVRARGRRRKCGSAQREQRYEGREEDAAQAAADLIRARRAVRRMATLHENRHRFRGDRLDLLGGALELLVGEHRRALERELAMKLEP